MNFDQRELRNCFSRFATGVAIASTNYNDQLFGLTINSFSSVSLEPPLSLFSIANKSLQLDIFKKCKNYAISFLGVNQEILANNFAKSNNCNKWETSKYSLTKNNNPVFNNILAYIELEHFKILEMGDHNIFIGQIVDLKIFDESEPLLYYQSKFCKL